MHLVYIGNLVEKYTVENGGKKEFHNRCKEIH